MDRLTRGYAKTVVFALVLAGIAGCEDAPEPKKPFLDLSVSRSRLNYRYEDEIATVTAQAFNIDGVGPVAFQIDDDALTNQVEEGERGDGTFLQVDADGTVHTPENPIRGSVAPLDTEGMAQVMFRCTKTGRVPLRAAEMTTQTSSEVKWITCYYRDPEQFEISVAPENPTKALGESTLIDIRVDDTAGGANVDGHSITIEAPNGGSFLPDQDSVAERSLEIDERLHLAVPGSPVNFVCPEETGFYTIKVSFSDTEQDGVNTGTTAVYCSSETVKNVILIQADKPFLRANGSDETKLTFNILGPLGAEPNVDFHIQTDRGAFELEGGRHVQEFQATTNQDGRYEIPLVAGTEPGEATITAWAELTGPPEDYPPDGTVRVEGTFRISIVGASSVVFSKVTPEILGVKGSGFNESARVCFQVMSSEGGPHPSGLRVSFSIVSNVGGASLTNTIGETDDDGEVCTHLVSGRVAANVTIRATVEQNGLSGDSPAIPIVGVHPNWGGFVLKCDLYNVGAFLDTDGINSRVMLDIPCRAKLKDRFGNPVGLSTAVSFRSEAGAITASVNSVPQDFSGGAGTSADATVGDVTALFHTFGVLPMDVPPAEGVDNIADEPVLNPNFGGNVNPRDGLVTIIAFVSGEEWFNDENGNGEYDPGEQFVDLAEPFVDYDDNGVRDPYEPFIDLPDESGNYNGVWDQGNGRWDRNTTIWTETRIMYTGLPASALPYDPMWQGSEEQNPGLDWVVNPNELLGGCVPICPWSEDGVYKFSLTAGQDCYVLAQLVDPRGNVLNASATYQAAVEGGVSQKDQGGPSAGDQLGIAWGLEKDCGPMGVNPICTVRSAISGYREIRPQVPLGCYRDPIRRLGHVHWVEIAHPVESINPIEDGGNENDDPVQPVWMEATVAFTVQLGASPNGGGSTYTIRKNFRGRYVAVKKQ